MTAPRNPWVQTGSGIAFDLLEPTPEMVNFEVDIAESLARIARFNGHIRSGAYSVAQHSVMGADALFRETGDPRLAAAFLLHDAHEAYIGDMPTPVKWALMGVARALYAGAGYVTMDSAARDMKAALKSLTEAIDRCITGAAGLSPLLPSERDIIKTMDLRMLATERAHLMVAPPHPWHPDVETARPLRLPHNFTVWTWPKAADEFKARCKRWLPRFHSPSLRRPRSAA
mgnify:FL=1